MKNIVIVGGGTAGWMAAIAIAGRFPDKRITVVDPLAVGPIGVGESVTGVVFEFVADPHHRLSMGEFFRRCDATFKTGIWYKNWQGPGTEYLAPIDTPSAYFKHWYPTNTEEFYALIAADGAKLGNVQLYSHLMRSNRTDYFYNPDGSVNSQLAYASCQFDALKFAGWLREVAAQRENIKHIDGVVESFEQNAENGFVTKIRTQAGQEIAGDFFLDCTGFHRLLFAKAHQPKWISYADYIKVDSAIPFFVPYVPNEPIPTYTMATAMPHGWMWQIPTQSRLGKGYLFASRYIDEQQAIAEIRASGADPGDNPRILRFEPGRFEKQWIGNVCAVGLSGGFIEPLEASTIHGMYVQIRLLTELFLPFCQAESCRSLAAQYNHLVQAAYEDYLDFISFHYHTGRSDTEFWRDYQQPAAITPANQARMEKWKYAFPMREDFAAVYSQRAGHTTGLVVWAPMLCGLGLWRAEQARQVVQMSRYSQMLQENTARYIQTRNRITAAALTHAETLRYVRGLS